MLERLRVAGLVRGWVWVGGICSHASQVRPPAAVRRGSQALQFEWTADGTLVVKKPQLPVDEDWTVEFN